VGLADTVFGRAKSADVGMGEDTEASSKHAALFLQKGALMVRDLGSSNGTFLNGTRIVRAEPIQDQDLILVGRTEVRVYLGAS
jgi:pSer/pThr/pTyr-binding forkhead associated (FHA) protein